VKVLMLGWELPPYNSGGLGVACYQLCRALADDGADIQFIVPYANSHPEVNFMSVWSATTSSNLEIDFGSYDHSNEKVAKFSAQQVAKDYSKGVERLVKLLEFDVIHAHDWMTFRAALRAKELTNKPLIVHIHATEHDRSGGNYGNPIVSEIEYTGMMMADKVIAISQKTKDIIVEKYNIPSDKIEVVHNSIDTSFYADNSLSNEYQYLEQLKNQGFKIVSSIGRLTIQKGLNNLVSAMAEVIGRQPKTILLMVGSGELKSELIEQAARLGIAKNVIFTDFQRGKRWRDAFKIADLFVLPSVSEPFGLTPLEAALYGTPSVVSKQSGVSEMLNNCLKVDFWDVYEMANKISNVLSSQALKAELSKNAQNEVANLSWSSAASKISELYHEHHQLIGASL
jgi:glycogen synthase